MLQGHFFRWLMHRAGCPWQVKIIEHESIICAGYTCVLHIHSVVEDCTIKKLIAILGKDNKPVMGPDGKPKPVKFVKEGQMLAARIEVEHPICMEPFKDFDQVWEQRDGFGFAICVANLMFSCVAVWTIYAAR